MLCISHSFVRVCALAFAVVMAGAVLAQADSPQKSARRHAGPHEAELIYYKQDFSRPSPGYGGWVSTPKGLRYFGPSYVFVPGEGILDAPCNLPTSACPNSMRDVN